MEKHLETNQRIPKKSFYFFILGLLLIAIIGSTNVLYFLLKTKNVPLDEIDLQKEPELISVESLTDENPYVAFYRTNDAAEEKLEGFWNYNFISPQEIITYGFMKDKPTHQYLFIVTSYGGFIKNIVDIPGLITRVTQDAGDAFLLITGITQDTMPKYEYGCITTKYEQQQVSCVDIRTDILKEQSIEHNQYLAAWDDTVPYTLHIDEFGTKQRRFTYNFENKTLIEVTTSTEKTEKNDITTEEESPKISLVKIPFFTIAYQSKPFALKALIQTKPDAEFLELSDNRYLLVQENKSFIIDVRKRTHTHFIDLPEKDKRIIRVYETTAQ